MDVEERVLLDALKDAARGRVDAIQAHREGEDHPLMATARLRLAADAWVLAERRKLAARAK